MVGWWKVECRAQHEKSPNTVVIVVVVVAEKKKKNGRAKTAPTWATKNMKEKVSVQILTRFSPFLHYLFLQERNCRLDRYPGGSVQRQG